MKPFLQLTRHLYEEPHHLNLVMIISNGNAVGAMEFYSSIGFIGELAQLLDPTQFQVAQVLERELGSELADANFSFYLRIRLCRMKE